MECELCGGTKFIKEFGYFYCSECQTQSQEIREHVFQEEGNVNVKSTKKVKEEKKHKKLTSWECYNFVIFNLTGQLIDLGANKKLKRVVKCLWLNYLEKLQVLDMNFEVTPKLQLFNSKRDAHILIDKTKKKKKRKRENSSSSDDYSSMTSMKSSSLKRRLTKKKTALVQSHYEQISQEITDNSSSLHNETLPSLKGDAKTSVTVEDKLRYNKYSVAQLKKQMSQRHLAVHKKFNEDLKCHKVKVSRDYEEGVYQLSPIKIYSLLYLGLLITRDDLQLSDLLRFIQEGHLNFNRYLCLLPDEYSETFLNIANNSKTSLLTSKSIRLYTAKLAKFLDVTTYIVVPDCMNLCYKLCKGMNLPGDIAKTVVNLLSKTVPKFPFKNQDCIPNYEGRIMSLILFTLKLLYGLDGVTEFHFSKYARAVSDTFKRNMFDITSWIKYIAYRKIFLSKYHFPTYHLKNSEVDSNLLLQYLIPQNDTFDTKRNLSREMKDFEDILTKIKDLQYEINRNSVINSSDHHSIVDYLKNITGAKRNIATTMFEQNYGETGIDFLLNPNAYLKFLGNNIEIKNGGANDKWVINELKTIRNIRKYSERNYDVILIEIKDQGDDILGKQETNRSKVNSDTSTFQESYNKFRQHIFNKNSKYLERISRYIQPDNVVKTNSYEKHYNPFERYWIHNIASIDLLRKLEFDNFFQNHPFTFREIFCECSRLIEQSHIEFFYEFQSTELFLTYSSVLLGKKSFRSKRALSHQLNYYITQAEDEW